MVELCKSFPRRWDRSTLSHLQIRKSLFHAEHLNVKKLLLTTVKWRKVSCTTLAFLDTLSRNFITFVPVYGCFLWIKIVSLRKTYVFWKQDQLRMGKGAELFQAVIFHGLTLWHSVLHSANCAIDSKGVLHKKETFPRFASWYGTT